MEKTIWKFQLKLDGYQEVEMPADAEIIAIQIQDNAICVWAIVNPSAPVKVFKFEIFGTGRAMADLPRKYVGTVYPDGYVFHVFINLAP